MKVKFHSKAKERIVGDYLSICEKVKRNARRKTLYYVDLFSGDGICKCKGSTSWKGSALIASKIASESNIDMKCIFNDIEVEKIEKLKERILKFHDFEKLFFYGDANLVYKEILRMIPPKEHSLFFLDPYKHSQLKWKTIEDILNHSASDWYQKNFLRRPEIIWNLMTYTMQTSYRQNEDLITEHLGADSNWKEKIQCCIENDIPLHKGFLESALDQLRKYYDYEPYWIEIEQLGSRRGGSVLYYLIFATNHPLAQKIFSDYHSKYIPKIKADLRKEGFIINSQIKAREKGMLSLDDFYGKN